MDFALAMNNGLPEMTPDQAETIFNNVYLSLMIRKGAWWFNPEFGSNLHLLLRAKNTPHTAALARDYCREALAWLITMGRATRIDVITEQDRGQIPNRLKLLVTVTQAIDRTILFETFLEVV